jgi:hypothetical protein
VWFATINFLEETRGKRERVGKTLLQSDALSGFQVAYVIDWKSLPDSRGIRLASSG